jgi:hypothetical protein
LFDLPAPSFIYYLNQGEASGVPKKTRRRKINFPSIFPEIKRIQSLPLRRGVLLAWEPAVLESGERDLFPVPFNPKVKGTLPVEHLQFVVKASLLIADQLKKAPGYKIDLDLLIASALLHNLGKVFEYRRQDGRFKKTAIGKFFPHGFWGAFSALREGLPLDPAHLFSIHPHVSPVPPQRPEGIILHYADLPMPMPSGSARGWRPFRKEGRYRMGQGRE